MIQIKLEKERAEFRPGEMINGTVTWADLPSDTTTISIAVLWQTRGKGDQDFGKLWSESVPSPSSGGEHSFAFKAPRSPYSFSGKLISLIWSVEAETFPNRDAQRHEFTLSPDGREIQLYSDNQLSTNS